MSANFEALKELVEKKLNQLVPQKSDPAEKEIFEAARYSLFSGGKRLRPLLTLTCAQIYDVDLEKALYPACALEMIHTYSLIHDDLPCMDDDDFRRGKPSLHRAYNEACAVLTGDFLFTYAIEIFSSTPLLSHEEKSELISILTRCSGVRGMLGGQMCDLAMQNSSFDLTTLRAVFEKKTAALMVAALESGALLGKAPEQDRILLRKIGNGLGFAFQLFDDLQETKKEESSCLKLLSRKDALEIAEREIALVKERLSLLSKPAPGLYALVEQLFLHCHA